MKNTFFIVFTLVFINLNYFQTGNYEGTYSLVSIKSNNLKRTLTLNNDGTFEFHNYEYHAQGIPPEKNSYGRGHWTTNKKGIEFFVKESDFNEKFTLDFNNTKAKFNSKSSRDKSNRDIKTTLRFYESEIFWIKGMHLVKVSG